MKRTGYTPIIKQYIQEQPVNHPIYTGEIVNTLVTEYKVEVTKAKNAVNVTLHRYAEEFGLQRYQKGIYFRTKETPFGKTKLNPALVNKNKFLEKNGEIFGYETGAGFLNRIGLSTQIPRREKFATNVFKQRGSRTDPRLNVVIRKSKITIDNENYRYLQFLDAVENKDKASIDVENPNTILHKYMIEQKLEAAKIMELAGKYYNKKTQLRLFEIIPALTQ